MSLDDALGALAREHVPDVLADAVRLARSRATAELADRLTKAIIAQVTAPPRKSDRGLCAYAITRDHPLDLRLDTDVEPRLVAHRGLGIVVAEMELARFAELDVDPAQPPEEDSPLVVLARQHDAVIRAVFQRHPVLPLRFGTVLGDEDAAVRLLRDRHDEALVWLDRVDGCTEWGVRARLADESPVPDTPLDGLSGTEYLAMRQKRLTGIESGRKRATMTARTLHEALLPYATDSASRGNANGLLLDTAYLVPAAQEKAFHSEIDRLTKDFSGVTVQTTGPWPPYSFTNIELAVGNA
ncbi:hypothetical protein JOF56_003096 [Kibdelosporangium banguiense]|uniref:Gas vesicle synthesis protein GvpL/GvpF n=1 Tax=Kibdelosporangium banguiense TaxID=1365924 RepID=A0ABS4TE64_9PSEU|nr:GvpL/GvpF family gas vesicle protein [Kibdelosporangium banguiense]MBP2322711.1 hypothetical protein [Kibdelosporangium banguiense]